MPLYCCARCKCVKQRSRMSARLERATRWVESRAAETHPCLRNGPDVLQCSCTGAHEKTSAEHTSITRFLPKVHPSLIFILRSSLLPLHASARSERSDELVSAGVGARRTSGAETRNGLVWCDVV